MQDMLFVGCDVQGTLASPAFFNEQRFKALIKLYLAGHEVRICSSKPDKVLSDTFRTYIREVFQEDLELSDNDVEFLCGENGFCDIMLKDDHSHMHYHFVIDDESGKWMNADHYIDANSAGCAELEEAILNDASLDEILAIVEKIATPKVDEKPDAEPESVNPAVVDGPVRLSSRFAAAFMNVVHMIHPSPAVQAQAEELTRTL